jgi:hypothetical protein
MQRDIFSAFPCLVPPYSVPIVIYLGQRTPRLVTRVAGAEFNPALQAAVM